MRIEDIKIGDEVFLIAGRVYFTGNKVVDITDEHICIESWGYITSVKITDINTIYKIRSK